MTNYPESAGYSEATTSKAAAQAIEASGRAKAIRVRLMEMFEAGWTGTVYDAEEKLGIGQFSLRPRFSELFADGKIVKVSQSMGAQGVNVWIWGIAK